MPAFVEKGVEHITRSIGIREELAVRLFVERNPKRAKPVDDLAGGKRFEDSADDGRAAAVEVAFGDRDIRDVAARAAADQNLRARPYG